MSALITKPEMALLSIVDWARKHFEGEVSDSLAALVETGLTALRTEKKRADQAVLDALNYQAYAAELERQRDHIANQLMTAETAGRMSAQREVIEEIQQTLRVSRAEALSLFATLTGDNAHILGDFHTDAAAELARDIADTLRREARPLSADILPALPDDFDPDSEEEL